MEAFLARHFERKAMAEANLIVRQKSMRNILADEKKVAEAAACHNRSERRFLFASAKRMKDVPEYDKNTTVLRSNSGVLDLNQIVDSNNLERQRQTGEKGFRFLDYNNLEVLETVLQERDDILDNIRHHRDVKNERDSKKDIIWIRPRDADQHHTRTRRKKESVRCDLLDNGKWTAGELKNGSTQSYRFVLKAESLEDGPPALRIEVIGQTELDDPDIVVSTYEIPKQNSFQWRSMGSGEDFIEIVPSDPQYRITTYYITVCACTPHCRFKIRAASGNFDREANMIRRLAIFDATYQGIKSFISSANGRRVASRGGMSWRQYMRSTSAMLRPTSGLSFASSSTLQPPRPLSSLELYSDREEETHQEEELDEEDVDGRMEIVQELLTKPRPSSSLQRRTSVETLDLNSTAKTRREGADTSRRLSEEKVEVASVRGRPSSPYRDVAQNVLSESRNVNDESVQSDRQGALRKMQEAFRHVDKTTQTETKVVWVCKDGPIKSRADLYKVTVTSPPEKPCKVLMLSNPPPIPPRCDYELYNDEKSSGDVSRKYNKIKSASQLKKILEKAKESLPTVTAPDYRGLARMAISGKKIRSPKGGKKKTDFFLQRIEERHRARHFSRSSRLSFSPGGSLLSPHVDSSPSSPSGSVGRGKT
uniref:Uncharacterized protein n=1 Tax=Hanusia phi TaxID=3032 RepID=A0A7S0ELX8_9CRYP|mmetsp:Transcript_2629/g.6254  ORF Transcript_2629/g.6254 Transcript_2629/m.6254 type:complete len:650 (+) Transcript_2629:164-2113(+)